MLTPLPFPAKQAAALCALCLFGLAPAHASSNQFRLAVRSMAVDAMSVSGNLTANASADFGSVLVGATAERSFTFTNTGNSAALGVYASVSGTSLTLGVPNTCGTPGAPVTVAKGASCSMTAKYSPAASGTMSGTVDVQWAGPTPGSAGLAVSGKTANVDFSSLMNGYTRDPVAIGRNPGWVAGGQWYWTTAGADSSAAVGTVDFRRSIAVAGTTPVSAYLWGAVDNSLVGVSVNGTSVTVSSNWSFLGFSTQTITLQPGINVISAQVGNGGGGPNPAGMLLRVHKADGTLLAPESGWKF